MYTIPYVFIYLEIIIRLNIPYKSVKKLICEAMLEKRTKNSENEVISTGKVSVDCCDKQSHLHSKCCLSCITQKEGAAEA